MWKDDSADGIKTGHTSSAGYCLIGSAKRNDMRLIAVVAGSNSDKARFNETQRLLEYGFRFYATQEVIKEKTSLKEITVWGGKSNQISLGVAENIILTLPRPTFKDLKISYEYSNILKAPIQDGEVLGSLIIKDGDSIVHATELIALDSVDAKGFFGRLWASFILWIRNLFSF